MTVFRALADPNLLNFREADKAAARMAQEMATLSDIAMINKVWRIFTIKKIQSKPHKKRFGRIN